MSEIFDITSDDIKELHDDDLRELIGRLCELDYRAAKIGTKGITWGGNQDAADGGLDVAVRDDIQPPINSHIPRKHTGFQIKKPVMAPADILKEMKPNGVLRDAIKTLISQGGAYIIVSSQASTTDSAITSRKEAMRSAVSDIENHENLLVDFYDRGRIATWVRSQPTLIPWVRKKIGRPMHGWQPYGNWSASPQGIEDTYLVSEGLIVYRETNSGDGGETVIDSLHSLRAQLSQPRTCVRLVGLSGVGKTRFVQALFDSQIGENNLHPFRAIYADMAESPDPEPVHLARHLILENIEAVLVIDNCPPDLHKRLVDACSKADSTIALITIEYDVREDLPEETSVVRLEPADDAVIKQLIERRFPHVNSADAQDIAEFSGGNARVAIALAKTINIGETLGRLHDADLFKRLFHQKNTHDDGLLQCAETLALVYSFQGTDTESATSELKLLATIIARPVTELYRSLAELQRRQLVQSRSVWRAILPHAIANRLAEHALKAIPTSNILNAFMKVGPERLLRSFTRRLSYLHNNDEAKKIATAWLAPDGWLGQENGNLNNLGFDILKNIAPVAPEETLTMVEHYANGVNGDEFISVKNQRHTDYVQLLRKLAYDPALFSRCVALICRFAMIETPNNRGDSTRDALKSLFYLCLSGTHAHAEVRAAAIKTIWYSTNEPMQEIALVLLDAAYEAMHFSSSHEFRFGARPRDWGWEPTTQADVVHWYSTFLSLGLNFARSNFPMAAKAKKLLADNFYGMWAGAHIYDELENLCDEMLKDGTWNEGWLAVRRITYFNKKDGASETKPQLGRIENKLKPSSLLETVRTYALSEPHIIFDIEEIEGETVTSNNDRIQEFICDLGHKLAAESEFFATLLPELILGQSVNLCSLGRGVAEATTSKVQLWKDIRATYEKVPQKRFGNHFLIGMLSSPHMDSMRVEIMDSLVEDPVLGEYYPEIQIAAPMTPHALARLTRALDIGVAPIQAYQYIGWGRAHEVLTDSEIVPYLSKICTKENGNLVVLDIIRIRFDSPAYEASDAILELTLDILLSFPYARDQHRHNITDYTLAKLAEKCLKGVQANEAARALCQIIASLLREGNISVHDYPCLFAKMAKIQPIIFLDTFLSPEAMENQYLKNTFRYARHHDDPLMLISDSDIIGWCEEEPTARYKVIAYAINTIQGVPKTNELVWNPLVYQILERAPNLSEVLEELRVNLEPRSWTGSMAELLTKRAGVLIEFFLHQNEQIAKWAKATYDATLIKAQRYRECEECEDKVRNETFE